MSASIRSRVTSPSEPSGGHGAGRASDGGGPGSPLDRDQIVGAVARATGRRLAGGRLGGQALPRDAVIAVAMSGGVDSAVAAALAVGAGAQVLGVTMRLWGEVPRNGGGCCSVEAVEDARRAATRLGIPHYVLDLSAGFADRVVADFAATSLVGRTPNPCVRCNQWIKFGALLDRVRAVGATHLATGHYARVRVDLHRRLGLHRAADRRKDQSYTLYHLDSQQLRAVLLPLGDVLKSEVRAIAAACGLGLATKPDSQDLCFVGGDHRGWLRGRLASTLVPGPIATEDGTVVGEHGGLALYTVGQRQGLGLDPRGPEQRPWYVLRLDPVANQVVVGPREALAVTAAVVEDCVYLDGRAPAAPLAADVQLRAHGRPVAATWEPGRGGRALVRFAAPEPMVAPGQAAVCYLGERVVAGGTLAA